MPAALHHSLRDLVTRLGPAILADSDELRGALDDYLDETAGPPAEIRLLVHAVDEGAPERLSGLLDNGADPEAAVHAVGGAVSDRAGLDERGARWAVAALGYAAGKVEDVVVSAAYDAWRSGLATRLTPPFPAAPASSEPPGTSPPPPPRPPGPAGPGVGPVTDRPLVTAAQSLDTATGGAATTAGRPRHRAALIGAVVVLAAVAAGGWWATVGGGSDGTAETPRPGGTSAAAAGDPTDGHEDSTSGGSDQRSDGPSGDTSGTAEHTSYVAFSSRATGTSEVHVLDLATGGERAVAASGAASQPSVSSDGRTVAFVLETEEGKRLAISTGDGPARVLDVGQDPSDPAISPDGTTVAYVTRTERGKDVSVLDLAAPRPHLQVAGSADEFAPAWSEDGDRLAYVLTGSVNDSIVVIDAASGSELSRTTAEGHAKSPALSPSGSHVAYVGHVQGNAEILQAELGVSGAPTNLSRSGDTEVAVVWLPDGRLVTAAPGRGLVAITTGSASPEVLTSGPGDAL
ncbi:TolB family protein [Nocardioides sp. SYSU DS0651]|uniref:TolB family protein n=1 Tax=Nocardioides sp. SYSU DS0651 TaxID=3415955 RepID=UPI003F4B469F